MDQKYKYFAQQVYFALNSRELSTLSLNIHSPHIYIYIYIYEGL